MRWLVERSRDSFDTVEAGSMRVLESGTLEFYSGSIFDPRDRFFIAPGQWLTVVEDAE